MCEDCERLHDELKHWRENYCLRSEMDDHAVRVTKLATEMIGAELEKALKTIEDQKKTIDALRRDIYEPSPDIQEKVLRMYGHL